MIKVVFRCDGGNVPEIGTGHIHRCKTIANFLKQNLKIKNKEIIFFTKKYNKYKLGYHLLKNKFNLFKIKDNKELNLKNEITTLCKIKSKILIVDRLDNFTKKKILKLKKNYKKIILIDSRSKYKNLCNLTLNPLIFKNYLEINSGFKYLIFPTKKVTAEEKKNRIFIYFGGYDFKKLSLKVFKICDKLFNNFEICGIHRWQSKKNKIKIINQSNFHKLLKSSTVSIVNGGLTLFNSIFYLTPSISIPQYNHQKKNIIIAKKLGLTYYQKNTKNLEKSLLRLINNKQIHARMKSKLLFFVKKFNKDYALNMILKIYESKNK